MLPCISNSCSSVKPTRRKNESTLLVKIKAATGGADAEPVDESDARREKDCGDRYTNRQCIDRHEERK